MQVRSTKYEVEPRTRNPEPGTRNISRQSAVGRSWKYERGFIRISIESFLNPPSAVGLYLNLNLTLVKVSLRAYPGGFIR